MENQELLQKAIDTAWGGQLHADDVKEFFSTVRDTSGWLARANWVPCEAQTLALNALTIEGTEVRAGTEVTTPTFISSGSVASRTLTLYEMVLPWDLSYKNINHSIMGDNVDAYLKDKFVQAFKNGMANNAITGSTVNGTPCYAVFDGLMYLAEADGNIANSNSTASATKPFSTALKACLAGLPEKYRYNGPEDLVFLVSWDFADGYANEVMDRVTPAGDKYQFSYGTPDYRGIPVVPVPQMPAVTSNGHRLYLTLWKNLFLGYSVRNGAFRIGVFDDTRQRQIEYTLTSEVGFQYAASDAIVRHSVSGSLSLSA